MFALARTWRRSACACRLGKHAACGAILNFATAEPHIAATINDIYELTLLWCTALKKASMRSNRLWRAII